MSALSASSFCSGVSYSPSAFSAPSLSSPSTFSTPSSPSGFSASSASPSAASSSPSACSSGRSWLASPSVGFSPVTDSLSYDNDFYKVAVDAFECKDVRTATAFFAAFFLPFPFLPFFIDANISLYAFFNLLSLIFLANGI